MVMATPTISQQRSFVLRGGGTGVFLDGDADHTMILRPAADGALWLECIQGDRHDAAALLRSAGTAPSVRDSDDRDYVTRHVGAVVTARIRFDPDVPMGVDDASRVLLYMPNPVAPGASLSHFDRTASPDLLMEPFVSPDLGFADVDLTDEALRDMGWRPGKFRADIRFTDDDGEGFKDPVLGPARRTALRFALRVWGRLLGSASKVTVEAGFKDLSCSVAEGATLAQAGPLFVFANFGSGLPGVWYPGPTAESIARADLSESDEADLAILFNAALDDGCLGPGTHWHYGLDDNVPPTGVAFLPVALHETAHGLGFVGITNLNTGAFFQGLPDILATMTFDNRRNKTWDKLSGDGARRKSAIRDGEVAFAGARTQRGAGLTLRGAPLIEVTVPNSLTGTYFVSRALFGPALDEAGVASDLVLVDDGTSAPTLACAAVMNGDEIVGKIAVIDRGECLFVDKVQSAQDVGAVGVVIVNNMGGPPVTMAGSNDSIAIPAVMVDMQLGKQIKRRLRR